MEKYLQYFYMISEIPHGSGNTKHLSDFLMHFAKAHGLSARQDEHNNVVIVKEAHPDKEGSAPVILQGHIDMVAVCDEKTEKNMETEGLSLYEEGDALKAQGTSLGGDDGIAVAYMLALLDGDYKTPPLECIFTSDEEIGMLGASALDASDLAGQRMINIDQEEEGIFIVGCAGGVRVYLTVPTKKEVLSGTVFEISLSGLKGGHSGIEIDKKRGNAIKALGTELCKLHEKVGLNLVEINGGYADNAIPGSATAKIILADSSDTFQAKKEVLSLNKKELFFGTPADVDEGVLTVTELSKDAMIAMDLLTTTDLLELLHKLPDGIVEMNAMNPGSVETSLNIGVIATDEDDVKLDLLVRSSVDEKKNDLVHELCKLSEGYGAAVELSGDYPGWPCREESALRDKMSEIYEKMFGKKPVIETIHAGLEGGIFTKKLPGLDCISIGPDIHNVHTPEETLFLSSAQRTFDFLVKVLACL